MYGLFNSFMSTKTCKAVRQRMQCRQDIRTLDWLGIVFFGFSLVSVRFSLSNQPPKKIMPRKIR